MSTVDPGKLSGILAVLGQNFYENGQRIAIPRSDVEEELGEDLRNELLFLSAKDVAEIFSDGDELYINLERENMSSAFSEREKLEAQYDGELQELVKNDSPTFIDYPDGEPKMEPEFKPEASLKFFYSDYSGLVATLGCFGQEKDSYTSNEVAGYISDDPTPHLDILETFSCLKGEPYRLTDERYERDADRINQFIETKYDGLVHEFERDFENQKDRIDAMLETMDLAHI